MPSSKYLLSLLRGHVENNEDQFYAAAMELAADEARKGHSRVAAELRELLDKSRSRDITFEKGPSAVPIAQPRGELAALLSLSYPETRLSDMVLTSPLELRLKRVLREHRHASRLASRNLTPRRKLLLLGPPGTGKTMTASALAGELRVPLFTIRLEGLITKFMGETAAKLKLVFDAMVRTRGVYFFDEFDAIGSRRNASNDVGEVRRILNSFLQFLENDQSLSLIVAATNHPDLLDRALYRRFDDVLSYSLPNDTLILQIAKTRLVGFDVQDVDWSMLLNEARGLSQADIVRATDEAAKAVVLEGSERITTAVISAALTERKITEQQK